MTRWPGAYVTPPVLADAGYGDCREFREGVRARGLHYLVGVQGSDNVWPPGSTPARPPTKLGKNGRPRTRYEAKGVAPWSIEEVAGQLPRDDFHTVTWCEGSRGEQSSRFAAVRVHTAERHVHGVAPSEEVWLLVEWPRDEKAPTKYYLSSLPADTPLVTLVRLAKLRWRVEHAYQELKGEVGLDHFEDRTWRGFHHHATFCMVAHGFIALRRALFSPEEYCLDAARGVPSPSAPVAAPHWPLSALPAPRRRRAPPRGPSRI